MKTKIYEIYSRINSINHQWKNVNKNIYCKNKITNNKIEKALTNANDSLFSILYRMIWTKEEEDVLLEMFKLKMKVGGGYRINTDITLIKDNFNDTDFMKPDTKYFYTFTYWDGMSNASIKTFKTFEELIDYMSNNKYKQLKAPY